jgi:hypothetical protein
MSRVSNFFDLRGLNYSQYEKDFTLTVNGTSRALPTFIAELISPRIAPARRADSTISCLSFTTQNPVNSSDLLAFFGVLGGESPDSPTSDLFQCFELICASLGNGELLVKEYREMTERNAVEVPLLKSERDLDICDHITFIASHFDSISGRIG